MQRGRVESVVFYESNVGEPNKSIVTLANGSISPHLMVFEGDMRNALPAGQKVEITFRRQDGHNVLVNVNYP
jgi:copper(I)-binding protein